VRAGERGNRCSTRAIARKPVSCNDPRNALIFPYKEEVGGSSPSTPTDKNPRPQAEDGCRAWGFAIPAPVDDVASDSVR